MSRVTAAPTAPPQTTGAKVSHQQIAARAYERWVKKGRPGGTDFQDWLEAEAELKREMTTGTARR